MDSRDFLPPDDDAPRAAGASAAPDAARDADSAADDSVAEATPRAGVGRWIVRIVGGLVLLVVVLVAGVLVALQTKTGAQFAIGQIVRLTNPYEDATITVESVGGNWISNLRLYGLRLTRRDGSALAVIDTLEARYNLLAFPKNRLHIREATLAGAYLDFRQGPDRVFDIQVPFLPDTLEIQNDSLKGQGLQLQLENLDLRRVNADFEFYNTRVDSIYRIRGLGAAIPHVLVTDRLDLAIDSIATRYVLPQEIAEGRLRTGLTLRDDLLDVRGFRLASTLSNVAADGRLRLPKDSTDEIRDVDFRLVAAPLNFADLAVFVPAVNPRAVLTRADIHATGGARLINLDVNAVTGDSARIDLRSTLTPSTDGAVRYAVSGQVRGLDPFYFTGGAALGQNILSADLSTDLRGESLERLSGPVAVTLFDARFGEIVPARTVLNGTFDTGELAFTLGTGYAGATLRAAGQVWPFDRALRYNVNARFDDVDVARITGSGQSTDLSGTLRLAGVGTSLDSARADARLDLDPSRVGPYRVRDGRLTARYDMGRLRFASNVAVPEGGLVLAGDARLDRATPTYRITDGRLTNFDVAAFTGQDVASRVNLRFTADGAGFDPKTLRLDATVDLGPTVYDRVRIERADATIRLTGGVDPRTMRLAADVDLGPTVYDRYRIDNADLGLRLASGRLSADVRAATNVGSVDLAVATRPFANAQAIDITRGRFANLDIGAITGAEDQSSDLTGTLTGRVNGFVPATMAADLVLTLDPSRYNAQDIQAARVAVGLRRGALTYDARLDVPGGETRLAGTARPFDEVPTYRVRDGYVAALDLGALLNDPALSTDLNGAFSLDGRGIDPETMRLRADLAIGASRYNDYDLDSGRVVVRLDDGFAEATARAFAAGGRADVAASGRFLDDEPVYDLLAALSDVDVGQFLKNDTLDAIGGRVFLGAHGRGFDPATMTLDGFLRADSSRYQTLTLDTLGAGFRLAQGVVYVDSLLLRSNAADARAHGYVAAFDSLAAGSDLGLNLVLKDLAPVRPLIGADLLAAETGTLTARLYGRPGQLRYEADGALRSLVYNDIQVANIVLDTKGRITPDFGLADAEGRVEIGYLKTPQITARQSTADVTFDGQTLVVNGVLDADDRRGATIGARLDVFADEKRIDLDALTFRFDRDAWRLARPASIGYGDRYRVSNFLLTSGDQQIAIDGVVDPLGEQNLVLSIDGFRIGAIADLFGFEGLDGSLGGTVDLTGPADAPRMMGDLTMSVLAGPDSVGTVDIALDYADRRLGTDAVFRHSDGSTLSAKGFVPLDLSLAPASPPDGAAPGEQAATGIALARQAAPEQGGVDIAIVADSFAVGWIKPFLDPETVSRIDGRLVADVRVTGQLNAPTLAGDARLVGGRVTMPVLGADYRDIGLHLTLADERIALDEISVRSGRGTVTGSGRIDFPDLTLGQFAIDLQLNNFQPINNDIQLRRVSGPLRIRGTTTRPRIEGDLVLTDGDVYLTSTANYEDVPLSAEDVRTVETRFGIRVETGDSTVSQTFQNMALAVRLTLDRDVWLRSRQTPQLDVQMTGGIEVRKAVGAPLPELFGDIEVIPERSKVVALGRRFNIKNGLVQFNGPLDELLVDLSAEYTPRRPGSNESIATITLSARGRPLVENDLKIEFGSDPQMDTADILSYIATGRPSDQALAFGGEGGGVLGAGAGLALGQLGSFLQGVAGRELGLDVIEIELDGTRGSQLTAGKYLSPRLYASVSLPLAGSGDATGGQERSTRVSLEYELNSYLLGILGYERQRLSTSLRWNYSY